MFSLGCCTSKVFNIFKVHEVPQKVVPEEEEAFPEETVPGKGTTSLPSYPCNLFS